MKKDAKTIRLLQAMKANAYDVAKIFQGNNHDMYIRLMREWLTLDAVIAILTDKKLFEEHCKTFGIE